MQKISPRNGIDGAGLPLGPLRATLRLGPVRDHLDLARPPVGRFMGPKSAFSKEESAIPDKAA